MFKCFNNKLYNKYYPITTEEAKAEFLNSNFAEIYRIVMETKYSSLNEIGARQKDYIERMKPTVSLLGTPKPKNIEHNKKVAMEMSADKGIKHLKKVNTDINLLKSKLFLSDYKNIEFEELNFVLRLMNAQTHRTRGALFVLFLLVLSILCANFYL